VLICALPRPCSAAAAQKREAGALGRGLRPRRNQGAPELKEPAVAKGQKKSNKEVRKPKAEKPKPAPAGQSFLNPFPKKK
jgi:hypothetical protein